jgi:hypothetical protein
VAEKRRRRRCLAPRSPSGHLSLGRRRRTQDASFKDQKAFNEQRASPPGKTELAAGVKEIALVGSRWALMEPELVVLLEQMAREFIEPAAKL